jgi:hypothetical protein
MKRYHLDVITGTIQGGSGGIVEYEVEADGFDYNNGCYVFKIEQKGTYMNTIVASFPINRTIIKSIAKI